RHRTLDQSQPISKVSLQRIDINVLVRLLMRAVTISPASAVALSNQNPVRRPIAGAGKPGRVDETFHQPRTIMVAPLEILHQSLQAHAQQPRGQIAALDAGPDQKSAQPDHGVQMRPSLFSIPTNPTIPVR